jgi:uncharacterized protein YbjT (DUF2867 family)
VQPEDKIMNLVIGSTGLLGMEICRQLRTAGRPTRALVRRTGDVGKRTELQQLGCELATGDLKDPISLSAACKGVHAVFSTASSTFSRQEGDSIHTFDELGQLALIGAAETAGVRRVVFVSFQAKPEYPCPLSLAKQAVEQRLQLSGLDYVILQASYFMEVWLTPRLGFDPCNGKVRIYGEGTRRLSWVSYKDVARLSAAAADDERARKQVLEVGGPEALSPREVVRMFEAAGAAEITTEYVPQEELLKQYEGATDPMQKSFAALMLGYALGDSKDVSRIKALYPGLRLTPVRDYISMVLAGRETRVAAIP